MRGELLSYRLLWLLRCAVLLCITINYYYFVAVTVAYRGVVRETQAVVCIQVIMSFGGDVKLLVQGDLAQIASGYYFRPL